MYIVNIDGIDVAVVFGVAAIVVHGRVVLVLLVLIDMAVRVLLLGILVLIVIARVIVARVFFCCSWC